MNAKKLPSVNWRARAYYTVNGVKKCKSFTAESKKEAEYLASMFLIKEKDRQKNGLTVGEAIDEYISSKENILSPTTIHCYREIKKNNLSELCNIPIEKLSPETLSNAHGLLVSVVNVYAPEIRLKTTLPKKQKQIKKFPEVRKIPEAVRGTEIELPCLLAIWQGLRMSEVRGIRKDDIQDGILTINRVIVTVDGKDVIKEETKTIDSRRQLKLPEYILHMIEQVDGEYITNLNRAGIYGRFCKILKENNIEHIRFHDLRHLCLH